MSSDEDFDVEKLKAALLAASTSEEILAILQESVRGSQVQELSYGSCSSLKEVFDDVEIDRDSGSGDYDGCHAVFVHVPTGKFFMITGWYGSYDGMNFEGDWCEAKAVQKVTTEWVQA